MKVLSLSFRRSVDLCTSCWLPAGLVIDKHVLDESGVTSSTTVRCTECARGYDE